jgi:serine carboxypeptidase-like clade 1
MLLPSAQLHPLAIDNYNFLLEWFNLFPEFRSNPFYVTGESYA